MVRLSAPGPVGSSRLRPSRRGGVDSPVDPGDASVYRWRRPIPPSPDSLSHPLRVILNPTSGSGAGGKLVDRLRARLDARGQEFDLCLTEGPGHATELARESVHRPLLLAVGGDGTLHEIVNGILATESGPAVAVLPVGTGNDFHRMVGTDRSIDAALDLIDHGREARFEVGHVRWEGGERHFVNVLGVGVDAEVLRQRNAFRRLPGLAQYTAALVAAVLKYRPIRLDVQLDSGVTFADRVMLAAVSVGPSAGGGFMLSPDARPDDGQLDLLFVEALNLLQVARYLPRVVRGTHRDLPVVRMHRLERVRLTAEDPFFFELDGELLSDPVRSLEIEVVPGRLRVLVPTRPRSGR